MTKLTEYNYCYEGKGEFELREAQVLAEVKVVDGIIEDVQFTSLSEDVSALTAEVTSFILGKSVSNALQFTCDDLDVCINRGKKSALTVMLEAFHRSLEEWLD